MISWIEFIHDIFVSNINRICSIIYDKMHTILKKWQHDNHHLTLVTISVIWVHHQQKKKIEERKVNKRKSNIYWEQIRTQMEEKRVFLSVDLSCVYLLEHIQYPYQWVNCNQANIIDRCLMQTCDEQKETWQL